MEPWFLTGFTDGEGCFNITIYKDNRQKIGWAVKLWFKIGLNEKDISLLEQIQLKFNQPLAWIFKPKIIENIYKQGLQSVQFRIWTIKDLALLINHFDN